MMSIVKALLEILGEAINIVLITAPHFGASVYLVRTWLKTKLKRK